MPSPRQNGFSLIELAIVLAIIGLLAGGIIGGQSLIRSMKLNNVLADTNKYVDAMHQFQDQYGYLPGDFPTAVKVWGKADGNTDLDTDCSPLGIASPDGIQTCNGDGDGLIEGQATGNNYERFENYRAWQHMAAAGLIAGKYSGVNTGGSSTGSVIGENIPAGALNASGYYIWSWGANLTDDGTFFAGDYNNAMTFGARNPVNWPDAAVVSALDAYGMDKKVDDGLPGVGSMRTIFASRTACNTTAVAQTSIYVRTGTSPACTLVFLQSYRKKSSL